MLSVEYAIFSIPYFSIGIFITNTLGGKLRPIAISLHLAYAHSQRYCYIPMSV